MGRKITIEPVLLFYMGAVFFEYILVQHSLFINVCLKSLKTENADDCEKLSQLNLSSVILNEITDNFNINLSWYNSILSLSSIFAAFFYGSWSDEISRKFPIIVVITSSFLAQLIFISYFYLKNLNFIYLFFLCAFISGISGASSNLIASSSTYLTDITDSQNRGKRLSVIEAMLFLGQYFGYIVGSLVVKHIPDKLIFEFEALGILHLLLLIYTCFFLEEVNSFKPFSFSKVFRFNHMLESLQTVFKARKSINERKKLLTLILSAFIAFYMGGSEMNLLFIYVKNPPFNWKSHLYGYFKGFNALLTGSILLFIPFILNKYFEIKEKELLFIKIGFFFRFIALILLGISNSTLMIFFVPVLSAFSELVIPFIRSHICTIVSQREKGKTFAVISLFHNLVYFSSSLIFVHIFQLSRDFFPGFCFVIVGVAQLIPLLLLRNLGKNHEILE